MNPVQVAGRTTLATVRELGRMALFAGAGVASLFGGRFYMRPFLSSCLRVGFNALPIVGMTAIFTGAALALNIYDAGSRFNAQAFLPQVLGISIVRELGPVLAALMLAGRSSSAMAAEIGAMRVSDQIDAVSTLAVDPIRYLVTPRLLAATLMLPALVLVADIIGVLGGHLVATGVLGFSGPIFVNNILRFLTHDDILIGVYKAGVFGFLLAAMGCYYGYRSRGGAQGVGAATRNAVVASAVLILASNYLMTSFFIGPR